MIKFRHVNVGKKLARKVADGYPLIGKARSAFTLSLSFREAIAIARIFAFVRPCHQNLKVVSVGNGTRSHS